MENVKRAAFISYKKTTVSNIMNNADKLYKKAIRDQQKRLKPGECLKYVRLVVDEAFCSSSALRGQLLLLEPNINVKTIKTLENCIYWERSVGQRKFVSNDELADMTDEWQMEDQVLKVLNQSQLDYHVKQKSINALCRQFKSYFPNRKHTLLIPNSKETKGENSNDIARVVVDLQVLEDIAIAEYRNSSELGATLRRFTKAIAEAPYKQQKSENLGAFKKYLANDKKQCVRVVGSQGFGRLWQQHLNRLPQVTLDVAEAIIAEYKCPKQLLDVYETNSNAVQDIADLKLNRSGALQPLQTERRIGNVLSQNLFTLYNTRDPNICI